MTDSPFAEIEKLEKQLWRSADELRANANLSSSSYFMPVLGIVFLRHAHNRFAAVERELQALIATRKRPARPIDAGDFVSRRALFLPEKARYDFLVREAEQGGKDPGRLVNAAMAAIEDSFPPLKGVLPREYGQLAPAVLRELLRVFNSEELQRASGDVFGRIYEYFLAEFSLQKAHDNGEFFTPPSLVQTIVNVIEPDHGKILDPACGSGGMFVQSSHFIERTGADSSAQLLTPRPGVEHMPRRSITLDTWGIAEDVTSTKLQFRAGEILFGKIRPYFHKVGLALLDGVTSSDAIVLRPVATELKALVLLTVSSDAFVAEASQSAREGSKMPRADWKLMARYPVLVPPSDILCEFNATIDPTLAQLRTLAFQNRQLRAARDLLLPKLMSGRIAV